MNGRILDTNIIIRYLVNDHPEHYKIAKEFFAKVKLGEVKVFLEQTVFTEIIFVLSKIYIIPRSKIVEVLEELLTYKGLYNHEKEVLLESLKIYSTTSLDIVDCVVVAKAKFFGLAVESFDKTLIKFLNK
jgi:predicted nucleic-acid-binding protein